MKGTLNALLTTAFLLFSVSAWSASTKQEVLELKAQVAEMQKDLAEIKRLLQAGNRAQPAPSQPSFREQSVSIGASPFKGSPDAPVTIIEYSDYQCPFCARHYREVLPVLEEEYIETGKLRFVMRESPIASIHRYATDASIAALCAGDQDKYWEMHNMLFDNQKQLDVENLKSFAVTLGLDTATFNECLDSRKHEPTVQADLASAAKLGVSGTPGFLLGLTDPEDPDQVNLSVYIKGAKSIDAFRASIDDLLGSAD